MQSAKLPLDGIRVIEFCHMVAGPTAGLILADLGADVIKIEPAPDGDKTRRLTGGGTGFFAMLNRNKRSVLLNLKSPEGIRAAKQIISQADVLLENFRSGAMDKFGLGADEMLQLNPRLIYCSVKGFLSGPYENRAALDEVVQMMAGLAYMTGLPGKPMRAGSSVNDIMGGLFGATAVLAALRQRELTGRGLRVASGLFETCTLLVAQHMMQAKITGQAVPPMTVRQPAWSVYDIFDCADGQLFIGVVTDTQWRAFCDDFGLVELASDPRLSTNVQRCQEREWLIPHLAAVFKGLSRSALEMKVAALGLAYAPIGKPEDLFDDLHLNASGGLLTVTLPDGREVNTPALPFELAGKRMGVRLDLPKVGEHTSAVLAEFGVREEPA
jgi:crotonobetainyl-CoA:carnitine CoA-transferase CaiB-like acyl-CoA transferase